MSVESPDVFMDQDCPDDESLTVGLQSLPVEIFLHICSFLDASTLVHNLGLTCKHFYGILSDDSLWKVRINRIWQNARYPVLPPDEDDELFWKLSCVDIEKRLSYWTDKNNMEDFTFTQGHIGTIDSLLLMHKGKTLISGGRDRSLVCWDLETKTRNTRLMAHDGWIWDMTALDNTVYSCSWDKIIKSWNFTDSGITLVRDFDMDVTGALLCVTSYPGESVLATGSFCRAVILFDPREGRSPIASHRQHTRAVMAIVMNSNYVLSASEDKTVAVWDQRSRKIFKTITISQNSYPTSMSLQKGSVYVGDSNGRLHVLDAKKDFSPFKSYSAGHTKSINVVHATTGCIITGSLDKSVRVLSSTDPPQLITSFICPNGEVAAADYANDVLAVSGAHIRIWRPRTGIETTI